VPSAQAVRGAGAEVAPPRFDEALRRQRLAFLDLTERDAVLLQDLGEIIDENLTEIVDRFYEHLLAFEDTRRLFKDAATVERLKEAQKAYLRTAVRGPYDAAYFELRWRIGYVHNAIQLMPHWFIGGFALYHRIIYPLVADRYRDDPRTVVDHLLALDKVMNLDLQLGVESYMAHYLAAMDDIRALNVQIEAASAAKSQLMANMSHEFRTPLNAILGFTEVLQDGLPGPVNDEQREYLGYIHEAGEHLLKLINDVLDLAKVEAGRLALFPETFPVGQTIRDSITSIRGEAERKGLNISTRLPPELGVLRADRLRFKQILYNLLSNAVKFTDAGEVSVSAEIEGGFLHVVVSDTGVGIREEDQAKVFEEFTQVNSALGRQHEGTGLGLALTKRLVEAHGGRIWVESRYGAGSRFHVLLPLEPPGSAYEAETDTSAPAQAPAP
jgi:signal transduction histidine kinase